MWGKQNNLTVPARGLGITNKIKSLWGGKRLVNIYLDISNLERLTPEGEWDEKNVEVIAHERIHLADRMYNRIDAWIDDPYVPGDPVYEQGEDLRNSIGP